jgi:hypothetical protein
MKIKKLVISYSGPVKPLWNCPAITVWESNGVYPVVYFRKPNNADQKKFDAVVQEIRRLLNESASL